MKRIARFGWLALPGQALLGAAPGPDPYDLIRQGNTAFARGDYPEARDYYEMAATRITDPGLAAFNKAAALYQLGDYREAERHYRYCLTDAAGLRRARAFYGLGNALLRQGGERGAEVLREAIHAYTECLRAGEPDAELAADAQHNLELAKLLLAQTPSKKGRPEGDEPRDGPTAKPPNQGLDDPGRARGLPGPEQPDPRGKMMPAEPEPGQDPIPTDRRPLPGAGLPPLSDRADQAPLSPHDAAQHLDNAVERIRQERRAHRSRLPGGAGHDVPD